MTNKEAIKLIQDVICQMNQNGYVEVDAFHEDALLIAIKELEQGPCNGCISKTAVIESIKKQYTEHNELIPQWLSIGDLESVTPEQKVGQWEYRNIANSTIVGYWCDNCHVGSSRTYAYCPNCGAKMEVEE